MTWVELEFTVLGEKQVSRGFEVSQRHAADMSDPLREIGDQIHLSVSEQFRTEGAHGLDTPWVPLNSSYAAWKRANFGPEPMLVRTGAMRNTLLERSAFLVEPQRLIYRPQGEHDDVAAYHQAGAGHLPQRKLVAITQLEKRGFERTILQWIRRDPLFSGYPT